MVKDRSIYTWIGFNAETAPPSPVLVKDKVIKNKNGNVIAGASAALRKRSNGLASHIRDHVDRNGAGEVSLTDAIKDAAGSAYRSHSSIDSGMSTPPIESAPMQDQVEQSAGDSGKAAMIKEREYEAEAKAPVPGILSLLSDSFHLLGAMRGIGYACGPPRKSIATPIRGHKNFIVDALKNMLTSHIIATFCLGLILHRKDWVPALLPLPLDVAEPVAEVLGYLAVGISMHAQMVLGFSSMSIVFWLFQEGGRRFVPAPFTPSEFDEREWPPLFRRPWEPLNVGTFWGQQWRKQICSRLLPLGTVQADETCCCRLPVPDAVHGGWLQPSREGHDPPRGQAPRPDARRCRSLRTIGLDARPGSVAHRFFLSVPKSFGC